MPGEGSTFVERVAERLVIVLNLLVHPGLLWVELKPAAVERDRCLEVVSAAIANNASGIKRRRQLCWTKALLFRSVGSVTSLVVYPQ